MKKTDDDVCDAAKIFAILCAGKNTEKLDGTRVKTALFDMLRSVNA